MLRAEYDPGTNDRPGMKLQVAQIVKGWIDSLGIPRIKVHDVAGNANNGAAVDAKSCKPSGSGAATLCAVWRDPAFDPKVRAFYYARVVQNPTCRWSAWECLSQKPDKSGKLPLGCTDKNIETVIQERAWTTAIWYDGK